MESILQIVNTILRNAVFVSLLFIIVTSLSLGVGALIQFSEGAIPLRPGDIAITPDIHPPYKVKVTFDSITVHDNHESVLRGDGEWKLAAYVQGKKIDLTSASGPGAGLMDVSDGETVKFNPGTEVTVDVPYPLPLSIFVWGEEVDCENPLFLDDASEKVIAILKGPDTREKMLTEISIFLSTKFVFYKSVCALGHNTVLGAINKIYEPIGYGAGAHANEVSTVLTTSYGEAEKDYTLRYTISVTAPPPPVPAKLIKPDLLHAQELVSSGTCHFGNNNLPVSGVTSSGSQPTFPPTNAIDDKLNTKWWSTFIVKPFITLDDNLHLGGLKSVCGVDIAWADGSSHPYLFDVSVSTDGTTFTNVLSGTSTGTTTSPEKYTFPQTQARFLKITITQSAAGSANSIAQISEIDIFG
jgi:hypothetical protein